MAKALQCDRCKKCFNPLTIEGEICHFSNPAIRTSSDYRDVLRGRYLNPNAGIDGVMDLCPECTRKFLIFMGGEDND